jgi:hypothetical protein
MRFYLVLVFAAIYSAVFGQRIQDFTAFDGGNGSVGIRFVISPGPVCSGFEVMHSTDSLVYKSVYPYDQECGSVFEPVPITWTHTTPAMDQTNYYKIQLMSPYETSDVRRVYVSEPGRSRLIAYPNPVFQNTDFLNLKAVGAGNVQLTGYICNRVGVKLRTLEMVSYGDLAGMNVADLSDGLYVIWLTDGSQVYSCKIIVKR